ncbi:MAG: hypothetical protein ACP5QR_13675 [Rhizomicrobium sp.]
MADSNHKSFPGPEERRERLANALRANLVRRKAAARAAAKRNVAEPAAEPPDSLEIQAKD